MAAVICRVVALPTAHTEYLSSPPELAQVWTENPDEAFVFPKHALADEIAKRLRESLKTVTGENGFRQYWFVHARVLEACEFDPVHGLNRKRFSSGDAGKGGAKGKGSGGEPEGSAAPQGGYANAPLPARKNNRQKAGEFSVTMDPKRAAEVLRDPVEAYG